MIHWGWLIPAVVGGCALGWWNARFFYMEVLPQFLKHYNDHTFHTPCGHCGAGPHEPCDAGLHG